MPTIQQTLTITLNSETLTEEELKTLLDNQREALAVFILNLLASDEVGGRLNFGPSVPAPPIIGRD